MASDDSGSHSEVLVTQRKDRLCNAQQAENVSVCVACGECGKPRVSQELSYLCLYPQIEDFFLMRSHQSEPSQYSLVIKIEENVQYIARALLFYSHPDVVILHINVFILHLLWWSS